MNKEEILKKSRSENKGVDELESTVLAVSGKIAAQAGMFICCVIAVVQVIFTGTVSFESWMIYFSILGTVFCVKYVKLRKKHELLLTILYYSLFVLFTALFIVRLAG